MKNVKYTQDHLRWLAEKYIDDPLFDFEQIKRIDITSEFFTQYKTYFDTGTLVVMNFNGHTTDGKSTIAGYITALGNKYLKNKMTSDLILGNQQEYAYWVDRHPDIRNTVIQIDEWSRLAETGANATIEQAYLEELSNIHAQMFVHRIYCSPHQLPDPNILLHLEVASKDIKKQQTVCYVYYNLSRGGATIPQIIGHIVVNVKDVLKAQWYKEYRTKKFQKMELLRKHKIYHERTIFYASAIKETIEHFKGLALLGKNISESIITNHLKKVCHKKGIRLTMLGIETELLSPTKGTIQRYTDMIKISNQITNLQYKAKSDPTQLELIAELKKVVLGLKQDIADDLTDLARKEQLYEEYKDI